MLNQNKNLLRFIGSHFYNQVDYIPLFDLQVYRVKRIKFIPSPYLFMNHFNIILPSK